MTLKDNKEKTEREETATPEQGANRVFISGTGTDTDMKAVLDSEDLTDEEWEEELRKARAAIEQMISEYNSDATAADTADEDAENEADSVTETEDENAGSGNSNGRNITISGTTPPAAGDPALEETKGTPTLSGGAAAEIPVQEEKETKTEAEAEADAETVSHPAAETIADTAAETAAETADESEEESEDARPTKTTAQYRTRNVDRSSLTGGAAEDPFPEFLPPPYRAKTTGTDRSRLTGAAAADPFPEFLSGSRNAGRADTKRADTKRAAGSSAEAIKADAKSITEIETAGATETADTKGTAAEGSTAGTSAEATAETAAAGYVKTSTATDTANAAETASAAEKTDTEVTDSGAADKEADSMETKTKKAAGRKTAGKTADGKEDARAADTKTANARASGEGEKKDFTSNNADSTNMPGRVRPRRWLRCTLSSDAIIRVYENSAFMRMPITSQYAGYTYNFSNRLIESGIRMLKRDETGYEPGITLAFAEDYTFPLHCRGRDDVMLSAEQFIALVQDTHAEDYRPAKSAERKWIEVQAPAQGVIQRMAHSTSFLLPDRRRQFRFYIPNDLVTINEDGSAVFRVPEDIDLTLWSVRGKNNEKIHAGDLAKIFENAKDDDYFPLNEPKDRVSPAWTKILVPKSALVTSFGARALYAMPDGKYEGFSYYYPSSLVLETDKGYQISIPDDMVVSIFNAQTKERMDAQTFIKTLLEDKEYTEQYFRPASKLPPGKIFAHCTELEKNVPAAMQKLPNWVVVRTRLNPETHHTDKFLISPVTGKFAQSDNPESWTTFENAMEYAKAHGADTLAFALDGSLGLVCIDIDKCIGQDGELTPAARLVRSVIPKGTYVEKSISGEGMHVFGKMEPTNVRVFSRDGSMEFYRFSHFISMTGDCEEGETNLRSFDTADMRIFVRNNFQQRERLRKTGTGVQGLSSMSDRDLLEKAFSSRGGEEMKQLFEGVDVKHNHSNSDMALMTRLAFWCNGNKEQMLRIFMQSGLYRPEKNIEYYECTIIKALEENPERYDPKEFRRRADEERARREYAKKSKESQSPSTAWQGRQEKQYTEGWDDKGASGYGRDSYGKPGFKKYTNPDGTDGYTPDSNYKDKTKDYGQEK